MFQTIDNKKNYQKIVEQIQDMILKGKIKNGDKLPSERELVEQLQVSRSSLREALKALEVMGLLESKQGEGSFVVDKVDDTILKSISIMYRLRSGNAVDIMQLRECLEIYSAKQIVLFGSDEDVDTLQDIAEKMRDTKDKDETEKLDIQFHNQLIKGTNNILFQIIADSISDLMAPFIRSIRKIYSDREDEEQRYYFIEQHLNIVNALRSRDLEKAIKEVEAHLVLTPEDIIKLKDVERACE